MLFALFEFFHCFLLFSSSFPQKEVRKHKGCTLNTITYKEPMHKNFALGLISRSKAFTWSSQNSLHFFKIHFQYQGIVCFLLDLSPIIRQCIFLRRGIKYIDIFYWFTSSLEGNVTSQWKPWINLAYIKNVLFTL